MRKALVILAATAVFAIVVAPAANAQLSLRPIDKSTLLTFSGPVRLPNVTLPAGTYLFKFTDPVNAPGILSVMSQHGEIIYAMIQTIPILRTETRSNHRDIVTFRAETPNNTPPAIDAWFFNAEDTQVGGDDEGCELLYSN
jgi:hypothetical protein